jgi:hypothetical protein
MNIDVANAADQLLAELTKAGVRADRSTTGHGTAGVNILVSDHPRWACRNLRDARAALVLQP